MTRPSRLGRPRPVQTVTSLGGGSGNSGEALISTGSNSTTEWLSVVQRILADGSPVNGPYVNIAAGSNITITRDAGPLNSIPSNTLRIHATGGAASFGSNATRVSKNSSVGALSTSAREDHIHDGIGTVTASSSNTMGRGTLNLRSGTNISFGLTDTDGDGQFDTLTVNNIAAASGGGGGSSSSDDPVQDIFGTPDTAFEFNTSSLTGLTAIGSPTTENANTTVPGALYYKDSTSSAAWMGRYMASPSTPFTVITKVLDVDLFGNFNGAGIIIGVADPTTGAFTTNTVTWNSNRKFNAEKFTNRTTFSSTLGGGENNPGLPCYLGVVVNSTTSIDYYWSFNGRSWRKYVSANNPSLTVGSLGLAMKSENSAGMSAAFDYLRVWNSAKTFP